MPMEFTQAQRRHLIVLSAALTVMLGQFGPSSLVACEIPVFRYALERWSPDEYVALVVHRQPLTTEQQQLAKELATAAGNLAKPANLLVKTVDLGRPNDDPLVKALQQRHETLAEPLIVLRQPHPMPEAPPVWTGALTPDNVRRVVDSPARKELVRRLTDGHSAVWVLLETGNAEQDDATAAMITKELARLTNELKLPDKQVLEADEYFKADTKVALKIDFSLLRLKPGDAEEEPFRAMLLASEPDLKDQKEPIALPIFGRGRACFALVGKGINAQQMEENSKFLTGRCSCQVKQDNPGVDLLIAADWDKLVGGTTQSGGPLPELSGLGVLVVDVEPADGNKPPNNPPLGQKPVTPVAAPTQAAVEPTSAVATTDLPSAPPSSIAQSPATPTPNAAPPSPDVSHPATAPLAEAADATGELVFWIGGVVAVGLIVALIGSLWLRSRGGTQA